MGKKPDQIEHDIREQRAHITRQIEGLQHRVQEDMQSVRAEAKDRASYAMDEAKSSLKVDTVKEMMQDHTLSTMAGALGLGVVLGVVSEGVGSGGNGSSRNGGSSNGGGSNGGGGGSSSGLGGLLASLVMPAASTAQDELQDLVRQGFSTLKGQVNQTGNTDKRVENRDVGVE